MQLLCTVFKFFEISEIIEKTIIMFFISTSEDRVLCKLISSTWDLKQFLFNLAQ